VEVQQDRDVWIIQINGSDLSDPVSLHKRFEEVIIHQGARKLLVDLSDVSYMNSMQIGAVVGLHVLAYENLSVVKFAGLHDRIKSLFRLLGVETLLDMHYARAVSALESFGVYSASASESDAGSGAAADEGASVFPAPGGGG
jgi:anti-anti-sigma factor